MLRRRFLHQLGSTLLLSSFPMLTADAAERDAFTRHQEKRRTELWDLLGDLPERKQPKAKLLDRTKYDGFTLERLELDLNGLETVPAILLVPDRLQKPAPALLYIHAHGGTYELGKEELLQGRKVLPAYAPVCAEKGLVT